MEEGLPEQANAIENSRETEHAHHWEQFTRAQVNSACTCQFPVKFGRPTNQITATSALAHAFREFRERALQASRGI